MGGVNLRVGDTGGGRFFFILVPLALRSPTRRRPSMQGGGKILIGSEALRGFVGPLRRKGSVLV